MLTSQKLQQQSVFFDLFIIFRPYFMEGKSSTCGIRFLRLLAGCTILTTFDFLTPKIFIDQNITNLP